MYPQKQKSMQSTIVSFLSKTTKLNVKPHAIVQCSIGRQHTSFFANLKVVLGPANLRRLFDRNKGFVTGFLFVETSSHSQVVGIQRVSLKQPNKTPPIIGKKKLLQIDTSSTISSIKHRTEAFTYPVICTSEANGSLVVLGNTSLLDHTLVCASTIHFTEQKPNEAESESIELWSDAKLVLSDSLSPLIELLPPTPPKDTRLPPQSLTESEGRLTPVLDAGLGILFEGQNVKAFLNVHIEPCTYSSAATTPTQSSDHNCSRTSRITCTGIKETQPCASRQCLTMYACYMREGSRSLVLEIPCQSERPMIVRNAKLELLNYNRICYETTQIAHFNAHILIDDNLSHFEDILWSFNTVTEQPWEDDIVYLLPVPVVEDVHTPEPDMPNVFMGMF